MLYYFSPKVILFSIWTYSLIWSVLPLFSENRYVLEGLLTTCSFDYINRNLTARLFQMTLFVCGFLIPLLVFILFYMLTYKALKSKGNIIRKNTQNNDLKMSVKSKSSPNDDPLIQPRSKDLEEKDKIKKNKSSTLSQSTLNSSIRNREFKLIRIIRLNVFVFCFAWVPYALVTLYAQFGANKEMYITPFSTSLPGLMAKFSSIYNPIIYVMTSDDCKKYIFLKKSR